MKWTVSWLLWVMLSVAQAWAEGETAADQEEADADV